MLPVDESQTIDYDSINYDEELMHMSCFGNREYVDHEFESKASLNATCISSFE